MVIGLATLAAALAVVFSAAAAHDVRELAPAFLGADD